MPSEKRIRLHPYQRRLVISALLRIAREDPGKVWDCWLIAALPCGGHQREETPVAGEEERRADAEDDGGRKRGGTPSLRGRASEGEGESRARKRAEGDRGNVAD